MKFNGKTSSICRGNLPHISVLTAPNRWGPGDARCSDQDKLQRHADSAHGGKVDPACPACREIQERYGVAAK